MSERNGIARIKLLVLLGLCTFPLNAMAESYVLPAQFWFEPRTGASVAANPVLAEAVRQFLDKPSASLVIRHAREDESLARAEELRGWLIALGLEAARLSIAESRVVANAADRQLTLEIIDNK